MILLCCQQDVDEGRCIRYPKLYVLGQQNVLFNSHIFGRSLLKGITHAIVIFFVLMGCYYKNLYPTDGYEVDYQSFGYIASGALTFVVNFQVHKLFVCGLVVITRYTNSGFIFTQIALDTLYWTVITHVTIWGSIVLWFVCTMVSATSPFYLSPIGYDILAYLGVPFEVLATGNFYFYCMLVVVINLFPVIVFRMVQKELMPTTVDDVRLKLAKEGDLKLKDYLFTLKGKFHPHIPARFRRPRDKTKPPRSGYAFAHEGGFGGIITTGLGLHRRAVEAGKIHRRESNLLASISRPISGRNSLHASTEEEKPKTHGEGTSGTSV